MATRATRINPELIAWARNQAGLDVSSLAEAIKVQQSIVEQWESGEAFPTYRQLEKIARTLKRPVAVFFFSTLPTEPDARVEFRTLPMPEGQEAARDTRFAIRDAHAYQERIVDLAKGVNPRGDQFLFGRVSASSTPDEVRAAIGVSIEDQTRWQNNELAFNEWRSGFEEAGIFVFKRSFKQLEISGFCLPHGVAPIVVVNNSTAWARQVFTLAHELAHLLQKQYGVTRSDPDYLQVLSSRDRRLERECNSFAAELLVPSSSFEQESAGMSGSDEDVEKLAKHYSVSREVVLRRFVDDGRRPDSDYQRMSAQWSGQYFKRSGEGKGGGNYYYTQASYLGRAYLDLAFGSFYAGESSIADLADNLNMKARNIPKLEAHVFGGQG